MIKPKLLIVADTYYPQVDGVLRFIEEFVKRAKASFEITLLVPRFSSLVQPLPGVNTLFLDVSKVFKLSTYPAVKLSCKNRKVIKEAVEQADLLFVQDTAFAGYLALKYGEKLNKRKVFYTHQFTWKQFKEVSPFLMSKLLTPLIKWLSIKAMNRSERVLVPYSEAKDEFREAGVTANLQIVKLGIDINRFYPTKDKKKVRMKLGLPTNYHVIGYVGRISQEKNTLVLLNAFKKLNSQRYFLLIVGDGNPEIVQKFKECPNCHITGFVNNVNDYLQAMDVFVMPSLTETTSLATLEAMSCGLPVIVTKIGFIKEYVVKEYNGLFFPKANPTILAIKVEQLFRNYALREKLGKNARKTIAYSFSWERSINKIKRQLFNAYSEEQPQN